jgi:hypothetical protein
MAIQKKIFPRIFHIGLPRTGTTTIQSVLGSDSRLTVTSNRYFQTPAYYSNPAFEANPQGILVHSDETMLRQDGNHAKMSLTLCRLQAQVPDAKIILTIREQRSWLLSRYRFGVGSEYVTSTFEEWLFSRQGLDFVSLGHFGMLYRTLLSYFPAGNIHVLPYELLRDDYEEFFRQVYGVIGLAPPGKANLIIHKNASLPDAQLACKRYLNRLAIFSPDFGGPSRRHEQWQSRLLKGLAKRLTGAGAESKAGETRPAWPASGACDGLLRDFGLSNRELCELAGIPLGQYGYCVAPSRRRRTAASG